MLKLCVSQTQYNTVISVKSICLIYPSYDADYALVVSWNTSCKCHLSLWCEQRNIFRAKLLEEEFCVDVTVQLTDAPCKAIEPALGGVLVRQEPFPVVNKRPITITMTPRSSAWDVRNNRHEQASFKIWELKCGKKIAYKYCNIRLMFYLIPSFYK